MDEQIKTVAWDEGRSRYRLQMLSLHQVEGVADAGYAVHDGQGVMTYHVSGYVSLEKWCRTRELNARELKWVLGSMARTLRAAEACLMGPGAFLLGPEWIFLNFSRSEVRLCVRPDDGEWQSELKLTARLILEAIDYEEEECVKLAYEFYHICMREGLLAEDLAGLVEEGKTVLFAKDGEDMPGGDEYAGSCAGTYPGTYPGAYAGDWIDIQEKEILRDDGDEKEGLRSRLAGSWLRKGLFVAAAVLIVIALWRMGF